MKLSQKKSSTKWTFPLFISMILLLSASFSADAPAAAESKDVVVEKTMANFSQIPGLTREELDYGRKVIEKLDYNSQRITRKISLLPGVNFDLCRQVWDALVQEGTSYEQILAFEEWTKLQGATMPLAVQVLAEIRNLRRDDVKSLRAFLKIRRQSADTVLSLFPRLKELDSPNNMAARKMFAVRGMTVQQALDNLAVLPTYTTKQAWAYAAFAETRGMLSVTVADALPLFQQLRDEDAWNMRTLIKQRKLNRDGAWRWLISYFAHPVLVQEKQYYRFNTEERTRLLDAFHGAGEELIWRINSLHAITDDYGTEISSAQLHSMSGARLKELFDELSSKTRVNYGAHFAAAHRAGRKNRMIGILRKATSADRVQVSEDLTSANIYALLAQGSELYDSSFRDILVPILKKRIKKFHRNNLLIFLQATDPDNLLVSSFIVSLAQKGKLTTFFPDDAGEQKKILELVAASAFKDEDSILLFSATFRHLLKVLESDARFYLIKKMVLADNGSSSFSKLLTVILQYYLQEYPELLDAKSQELIRRFVARNGAVNLDKYLQTPFAEWKQDKQLGSISVFHPDDDGRKSFISNARNLISHGYRIEFSSGYTSGSGGYKKSKQIIAAARKGSADKLAALFAAMRRNPFAVAFVRKVNDITLRHTVYVYANEENQELLIRHFLESGDEMLAQRGHSYWRSEQITDPMENLKESGKITDQILTGKQRFLSLGSCGGVKAYTRLTRMFLGHVDILATIGTGMAIINDPYNRNFFEIIANNPSSMTWEDMAAQSSFIFGNGRGQDYLQPGCLTAILHKILEEEQPYRSGFSTSPAIDE
ncbi:MAG: hypothetical protein ACL93V_05945 [Candidatus Electrothrix sp. YB6]